MFSRTKAIYIYIYIFVWCSIALSCRTCAPFSLVMNFALIHVKNTGRKRHAKYFLRGQFHYYCSSGRLWL